MAGICYIIGAGDVTATDIVADDKDYIICADGGYKYKTMLGRECDMVVGDFDSFGRVPETENKIVAPAEKDAYLAAKSRELHDSNNKSKIAKKQYRNQGKYIEEILL